MKHKHSTETVHNLLGTRCEYKTTQNRAGITLEIHSNSYDYHDTYTIIHRPHNNIDDTQTTTTGEATITDISFVYLGDEAKITHITLTDKKRQTQYEAYTHEIIIRDYTKNTIHKHYPWGMYSEYHPKDG